MKGLSAENILSQKTIISIVVFWLFFPAAALATVGAPGKLGFSAEPAVIHASVAPSDQFRSSFSIRNIGNSPIALKVRVVDFVPEDNGGGVHEVLPIEGKEDPVQAAGWFAVQKEKMIIPERGRLVVPYSILVPGDANPGARSVAFVLESIEGQVLERLNVLVFLSVPGEVHENLVVQNLSLNPFISSDASGQFHLELKNNGNTHLRPDGEIVIRNMFGAERGRYMLGASLSAGTLVPSAKRSVEYSWKGALNAFDFGLWNARIVLNYGGQDEHSIAERTFFLVLPWRAMLLIIFIIGGAVLFFMFSVRRLRSEMRVLETQEGQNVESVASLRLLIIPFIAGLLLLLVIIGTLFSVFQSKNEGSFERVNQVMKS